MPVILRIEHGVRDFDTWKAVFDRDPVDRAGGGVRRYRILRPADDPRCVLVDLEFDDLDRAKAFGEALGRLWGTPVAQAAMSGEPRARILDAVETVEV